MFPKMCFLTRCTDKTGKWHRGCCFILKSLQPALLICNQNAHFGQMLKQARRSADSMMHRRNVIWCTFAAAPISGVVSDCCVCFVSGALAPTSLSALIYPRQFPCVDAPVFVLLQSLCQLGTNKQPNCPFLSWGAFCHVITLPMLP